MTFITAAGLQKKTLAEIRKEFEADVQAAFGVGVDLSPDDVLGQIIAIGTKREADVWELAQEIYSANDKDQATGVQLDDALNTVGVFRLPATPARVDDVLLWLTFGAAVSVAAGSTAKSATAPATYALESTVSQAASATGPFRAVRLSLTTATVGATIVATMDDTTYSHTIATGESVADALGLLANSINAGAFGAVGSAVFESVSGTNCIRIEAPGFTLNSFAGLTAFQSAQAGIFVASSAGTQPVPAGTLDTIASPVSGWLAVEQPAVGTDGTDIESDTQFRLRALRGIRSGSATVQAITEALYRVDGVSKVFIKENTQNTTDTEGRPGTSYESVVVGGTDANIAAAIYANGPAGIQPYGINSVTVTGTDGVAHAIGFSRPVPLYAWVEVTLVSFDPDQGPTGDYMQVIKDSVALYGRDNFDLGNDFVLQKLYAAVYSVPGIYSVIIRIATTSTATGTPTYQATNIAVKSREYLSFDSSRVRVSIWEP